MKTREDSKAKARRAAMNALRRARRAAARAGVDLSAWEGEFITSMESRLELYGRAFGDPEKGAAGDALSALQRIKLKEITVKALGGKTSAAKAPPKRARFDRMRRNRQKPGSEMEPNGSEAPND